MKLILTIAAIIILAADLLGQPFNPQYKVFRGTDLTQENSNDFLMSKIFQTSQNQTSKLYEVKLDSLISTATTGEGSKHFFDYDENGNMIEWLILFYFNGQWSNDLRHQFFYDNGLKSEELVLGWNSTGWDSLLSRKYLYSGAGLLTQTISRIYSGSSWDLSSKSTYKYNTDSLLTAKIDEKWENDQWNNFFSVEYFYNNRNLLDSFVARNWSQGNWVNYWNTHFYYSDGFIDPDSIIAKLWGNSTWQNSLMQINYRIGNNDIEQIEKDWNGSEWVNSAKRIYERDENRFLDYAKFQSWIGNGWVDDNGVLMVDNPDGFNVAFVTLELECYNSLLTNVEEENSYIPEDFVLYQNYPNPFNPTTKIKYSIPTSPQTPLLSKERGRGEVVSLKVFDVLGKEITTLVNEIQHPGTYEVEFNASNLPSGIYFYRLIYNDISLNGKMVLLK